jgi:hypothetical protein
MHAEIFVCEYQYIWETVIINREKRYVEYTLADKNDNLVERVTQRTCEEGGQRSTGFPSGDIGC